MRVATIIRRAIARWHQWRFDRARQDRHRSLRKAVPALAALDSRDAEARRQHRSGARHIAAERKRLVTARLMQEMGMAPRTAKDRNHTHPVEKLK